jgi:hypothetical protein
MARKIMLSFVSLGFRDRERACGVAERPDEAFAEQFTGNARSGPVKEG